MRKGRKLDIEYSKLVEIAKAINDNTVENKSRSTEEKINTDKFIRRTFHIDRRDFSATIQDTDIKYNKSTHLYDIGNCNTNTGNKSDYITKVMPKKPINTNNCNDNTTIDSDCVQKIDYLVKNLDELKNTIEKYNKKLDVLNTKLLIDTNDLRERGSAKPACFRIYESVYTDFKKFIRKHKEYKSQDIVSAALLDYMEKYNK